eukprot:7218772-Prymnesium_polylepis.2
MCVRLRAPGCSSCEASRSFPREARCRREGRQRGTEAAAAQVASAIAAACRGERKGTAGIADERRAAAPWL